MNIEQAMLDYAAHDDYHVTAALLNKGAKEIIRLRRELARAVRDIERLGTHTATYQSCHVCATVKSYGFDPEALREEVGAGETADHTEDALDMVAPNAELRGQPLADGRPA